MAEGFFLMSSIKQTEANRLNAQKSTGPRTLQGKAVSRFNALKSGIDSICEIIPGEDPDELSLLADEYHARWQPSLPEERFLVDGLVHADWLHRRLRKAEAQLWMHVERSNFGFERPKTLAPMGVVLQEAGREFARLQRRIDATNRAYAGNLKTLQGMLPASSGDAQPEAPGAPLPEQPRIGFVPQPAEPPEYIHAAAAAATAPPEIGFVPQPAAPPSAPPANALAGTSTASCSAWGSRQAPLNPVPRLVGGLNEPFRSHLIEIAARSR
jgi:hypothetical protein